MGQRASTSASQRRAPWGARCAPWGVRLCAAWVSACTVPSFDPIADAASESTTGDAGPSEASAHDAAPAPNDAAEVAADPVAAERAALVGRYVKRTISFARGEDIEGQPLLLRAIETSVVEIADGEGDSLRVTSHLCSLTSNWVSSEATKLVMKEPEAAPPMEHTLSRDPATGRWAAREAHRYVGYDPEQDTRCAGLAAGSQIARHPEQTWLSGGLCRCTGGGGAPPASADDCRLLDPERDGAPGVTLLLQVVAEDALNVSFDAASSLEFMTLDPRDGVHGVEEQISTNLVCALFPLEICPLGATLPCGKIESQWRRAPAEASCGSFEADGGKLLPSIPQRVEGC